MLVIEILRRPHLMLADACADDGFALCNLVEALQDIVRLDEIAVSIVIEWMALLQLCDAIQPRRKIFLKAARMTQEILKAFAGIRNVRPGDLFHFPDFGCVDVDMRDVFCVWREGRDLAGDAIVKARSD